MFLERAKSHLDNLGLYTVMSTDDYLTNVSSNRSHLGAKSSHFQAKIKSHTSYVSTVALIKDTECNTILQDCHN